MSRKISDYRSAAELFEQPFDNMLNSSNVHLQEPFAFGGAGHAKHLWFVPTNCIGIGQLRRIAYEDLNAKRDEVIASAVENVGLLRNKNSVFPLMNEEGRWYAYGADLDICVVQ